MKRLFIILSLVGSTIFTSTYAAGTKTVPVVNHAFETTFSGAKDITWEQVGVLYKVTFAINGEYASAFYNSTGDLIAQTRNMTSQQLPQTLASNLKKEMKGYWITDAFAVMIDGDTTYYVNLENADESFMLKSVAGKKWEFYKKNNK